MTRRRRTPRGGWSLNKLESWIAEMRAKCTAHHVLTGNWPALMSQCSHADLRPVRVRGERRERRMAG